MKCIRTRKYFEIDFFRVKRISISGQRKILQFIHLHDIHAVCPSSYNILCIFFTDTRRPRYFSTPYRGHLQLLSHIPSVAPPDHAPARLTFKSRFIFPFVSIHPIHSLGSKSTYDTPSPNLPSRSCRVKLRMMTFALWHGAMIRMVMYLRSP